MNTYAIHTLSRQTRQGCGGMDILNIQPTGKGYFSVEDKPA